MKTATAELGVLCHMSTCDGQCVVLSPEGSPHAIVAVSGEIDSYSAPSLTEAINRVLRDRPRTLTLDVTDVSFIGSAGISALVHASVQGKVIGTAFRLWNPSRQVRRLLDLTGLPHVVPVLSGTDPLGRAVRR